MHALEALAHAAAPQGQFDLARSLLTEAYELNSELGDRFREAVIVCRFARLLAFSGRVEAAARVLAAGETLTRRWERSRWAGCAEGTARH